MDGLGALVITPTRELAYQIFEVLNNVGSFHTFSAALVIGGKVSKTTRFAFFAIYLITYLSFYCLISRDRFETCAFFTFFFFK